MPIKKVFLSSTARDLKEYREAAYTAIEGLDGYHCVRMEDFGARDDGSDEFCRAKVAECDLLVGIVGHLYGSCPEGSEKSYTEREYEAAVDTKIPRLMFVAPDSVRPPPSLRERDEIWIKQQAFRERVSKDRIRAEFTSPENLATKITRAIRNWEHENVVRKRTSCINKSIPFPPNPFFAHPYPPPANFTGRKLELEMLTNWLNNDERQILALVAMGGMGKSFLSWHWLQNDVDFLELEGALWWSFYEGESSFSKFLDESIIYASGQTIDPSNITSEFDKTRILVSILQEKPFLIILDGFERLLRNYDPINVEDENDENFDDINFYGRACTDHNAARFLRYLANGRVKSKILITTRLMVHDLEDQAGNPLRYCYKKELMSLNPEDAVAFMKLQGVTRGTSNEIRRACAYYDFHPLSLRILSGLIKRDKENPGDINTAPRYDVHTNLRARRHHILEVAYKSLPNDWQILLSKASSFRGGVIYDALLSISDEFPDKKEFEKALDGLMDWGLLLFDKDNVRFELHPIVRRYAYDRLNDKIGAHKNLKEYFITRIFPHEVKSINDITTTIELCYHTFKSGLYNDAYIIYRFKLSDNLFHRFGAYQICFELLSLFYSDKHNYLPKLSKASQGWILNELSLYYRISGQQRLARSVINIAIPLAEELKENINKSVGVINLSESQFRLGELNNSELSIRKSLEYLFELEKESNESQHQKNINNVLFQKAYSHSIRAQIFNYMGCFNDSAHELDIADELEKKRIRKHYRNKGIKYIKTNLSSDLIARLYSYRAFRILLMEPKDKQLNASVALSKRAISISKDDNFGIIMAKLMLGLSLTQLALTSENDRIRILSEAGDELKEALELCRRTDLLDLEPDILLAWARWHQVKNEEDQAIHDAEEALYIANRFEYRLKQAEIHNFLAQMALNSDDVDNAKLHAGIAYNRAWCDGPPYCYKPALDEAKGMLHKLGLEPPKIK